MKTIIIILSCKIFFMYCTVYSIINLFFSLLLSCRLIYFNIEITSNNEIISRKVNKFIYISLRFQTPNVKIMK